MYTFKENDILYDWISVIVPDRIYFGPYPSQYMVDKILQENFDLIVDLTDSKEPDTVRYRIENKNYMTFPIPDNSFPTDPVDFCKFILTLNEYQINNKKIYIHCRGGHGRSSMTTISLMCVSGIDFRSSVDSVIKSHNTRVILRPKWKRRSPLNYLQFNFLTKIHKDLYINLRGSGYYGWLSLGGGVYDNLKGESDLEIIREKITEHFSALENNKDFHCRLKLTYLRKFIASNEDVNKLKNNYIEALEGFKLVIFKKNL
jgi:hypothetical protein